jgi:hypothetical protein
LLEETQDRLDHRFVPRIRIYHGMVQGTIGPLGMEVIPDESNTFAIDCIDQYMCVGLFLTFRT